MRISRLAAVKGSIDEGEHILHDARRKLQDTLAVTLGCLSRCLLRGIMFWGCELFVEQA
jgi:hypothetical protein